MFNGNVNIQSHKILGTNCTKKNLTLVQWKSLPWLISSKNSNVKGRIFYNKGQPDFSIVYQRHPKLGNCPRNTARFRNSQKTNLSCSESRFEHTKMRITYICTERCRFRTEQRLHLQLLWSHKNLYNNSTNRHHLKVILKMAGGRITIQCLRPHNNQQNHDYMYKGRE